MRKLSICPMSDGTKLVIRWYFRSVQRYSGGFNSGA